MKKVLFATTALVATTGFAAADVSLSGLAQMGIQGGENVDTTFVQDIDVTFTLSGETDNGLTFGAAIDLDENAGAVGSDDAGVAIFISGDWGTLTMGDTDGALDWAMTEVNVVGGSINDDETAHVGFNGNQQFDANLGAVAAVTATAVARGNDVRIGFRNDPDDTGPGGAPTGGVGGVVDGPDSFNIWDDSWSVTTSLEGYDGQILRYDYTVGGFGVAVSVQLDDDERLDPMWGIGARYSMDFGGGSVSFGAGYQDGEIEAVTRATYRLALPNQDPTVYDGDDLQADELGCDYTSGGDPACILNASLTGNTVVVGREIMSFNGGGVSAAVELDGGFEAAVNYSIHNVGSDVEIRHTGVGLGYTVDAFSIGVNWGQYTVSETGMNDVDINGWGLAAVYDLGGGLTMHLGYGDGEVDGVGEDATYSLGLSMSF